MVSAVSLPIFISCMCVPSLFGLNFSTDPRPCLHKSFPERFPAAERTPGLTVHNIFRCTNQFGDIHATMPRKRMKDQSKSPLCALPAEVRLIVMRELLQSVKPIVVTSESQVGIGIHLSILRTCQMLYNEGSHVFRMENTLQVIVIGNYAARVPNDSLPNYTKTDAFNYWMISPKAQYVQKHFQKLELVFPESGKAACSLLHAQGLSSCQERQLLRLEETLRCISKQDAMRNKMLIFTVCECVRDRIIHAKIFADRQLKGVFELLRCKTFSITNVAKHEIKTICSRVESQEAVVDLIDEARKLLRRFNTARDAIGESWRDQSNDVKTAKEHFSMAAWAFDIPEYLKQKQILDRRLVKLHKIAEEQSDLRNQQLRALHESLQ